MLINSSEYLETIEQVKSEIRVAQYKAVVSVNQELILLYHSIGEVITPTKCGAISLLTVSLKILRYFSLMPKGIPFVI